MNAPEYVTEISIPALAVRDLQALHSSMPEAEAEPELEVGP